MLLILLALAAIPGSVIPQRGVSSSPLAVPQFASDNPSISPWLDRLGLFNVYGSVWFAAIYLLLLASMIGCVVPRCLRIWSATRQAPPNGPSSLRRLPDHQISSGTGEPSVVLDRAAAELRRRRFRVVQTETEVRAEKGYLREYGNLAFHLSLLVLLVGIGYGKLWGFEGRAAFPVGTSFSHTTNQYDEFSPAALTDVDDLEPFLLTLEKLDVAFETAGPTRGQPRLFDATVTLQADGGERTAVIKPNHPLNVNGTKVFLTGQGYAPEVTVRDGRGDTVFTGPVMFLPIDGSYASDGVVKAPSAMPTQLGFEGLFLPTAAFGPSGPYSSFPDTIDPRLIISAYTGDLGMDRGPQSVFVLDKTSMDQVMQGTGPLVEALQVGQTMRLPGDQGSITFDGVSRFANFQIAYDPGKEISLVAGVVLLIGLSTSLSVRRRRVWARATPLAPHTVQLEIAGLPLTRRGLRDGELATVARTALPTADSANTTGKRFT